MPFTSPGDLSDPGTELWSPELQADSLPSEPPGNPPESRSRKRLDCVGKSVCVCVCRYVLGGKILASLSSVQRNGLQIEWGGKENIADYLTSRSGLLKMKTMGKNDKGKYLYILI